MSSTDRNTPVETAPGDRARQRVATGRFLHVLNGDSMAETMRGSTIEGTLLVWADVLHEGPVAGATSAEQWRERRARFLAGERYTTYEEVLASYERWDAALERFVDHDEVVLWFEHDLFDQLLLIRHLDWFSRRELGRTTLQLICIGAFPGIEPFHGLGQLDPVQLASLLETRTKVTPRQLSFGRRAWGAFTSGDPMQVQRLVDELSMGGEDADALPFLAGALRRLLEEFPSVENGLGRTERHILDLVAERGPIQAMELFRAEQRLEERVFMGDSTFWRRVHGLMSGAEPLLAGDVHDLLSADAPTTVLSITTAGELVRAAARDRVRLEGIDGWVGGVRLHAAAGGDVPWRWSVARGRLTPVGSS